MIDDMGGLFRTARDAYREGKRDGARDALKAALDRMSWLSANNERNADPARFHAFEDACTAIRHLMDQHEAQAAATDTPPPSPR